MTASHADNSRDPDRVIVSEAVTTQTPSFLADLPLARDALDYARKLHEGQRRASDDAPFIVHPLEVAALLHNTGHAEPVVAAGMLHDTVEKADVRPEEIADRFGPEVAGLVAAMTEDPTIERYEERKAALRRQIARFGHDATAVYAADKVAKVRELRAHASREPSLLRGDSAPGRRALDHYLESALMLEREAPDHPLVRQLRFELDALQSLPPADRPAPR
jgi:(p)ppGpp synthase/HD superfamily hydrolase